MLRNFLIFSLCFVAIKADGQFLVLNTPKSVTFSGEEPLSSDYVDDALFAAGGNPISGDAEWSALTVNDPFAPAKHVVAVAVEGMDHISLKNEPTRYALHGNNLQRSLDDLESDAIAAGQTSCSVNFTPFEEGVQAYQSCFGAVTPLMMAAKHLQPATHTEDKEFLQALSYIQNIASKVNQKEYLIIRLSLEPLKKVHGAKSEAVVEAQKLVSDVIGSLSNTINDSDKQELLFVAITNDEKLASRQKRQVVPPQKEGNPYNLATYYNQDYPVIFNIILWFMVAFGLSLLAICYAIGEMDPGRDSIIYRMTSTRMKKDN